MDLRNYLEQLGLEQYYDIMREYGVDSIRDVLSLGQTDFDVLQVKPFHRKKLQNYATQQQMLVIAPPQPAPSAFMGPSLFLPSLLMQSLLQPPAPRSEEINERRDTQGDEETRRKVVEDESRQRAIQEADRKRREEQDRILLVEQERLASLERDAIEAAERKQREADAQAVALAARKAADEDEARRKAIELQAQREQERKLEAKRLALEEQRRRDWEAVEERRLKAIEDEKRQTEDRRLKDDRKREKAPYVTTGGPSNTAPKTLAKAAPKVPAKAPLAIPAVEKKKKKKPPTNLCHQWKSDGICTFTAGMNAGKARGAACLFNHDPEWRGGPDGPNGWNKNANNNNGGL